MGVAACSWQHGPFTPGSPRYCDADPQCPVHQHCGPQCLTNPNDGHCHFVCMSGASEIDSYPDTSPP